MTGDPCETCKYKAECFEPCHVYLQWAYGQDEDLPVLQQFTPE